MSVRLRFQYGLGSGDTACPWPVFDDDSLANLLGQSAGDCAGRQIGHSSRAEGHHDTDRFAGKVLRQGGLHRYGSQHERQGRAEERSTLHDGAKS
jgi:hypothetical protein